MYMTREDIRRLYGVDDETLRQAFSVAEFEQRAKVHTSVAPEDAAWRHAVAQRAAQIILQRLDLR